MNAPTPSPRAAGPLRAAFLSMAAVLALGACQDGGTDPAAEAAATEAAAQMELEAGATRALALQDSVDDVWIRGGGPHGMGPGGPHDGARPGRYQDPPTDRVCRRPELVVALSGEAVELAVRLLGDGADDEQLRFLDRAMELQGEAEAALAAGEASRAAALAHYAHLTALKAVVLPGGVNPEEVERVVALARDLLEEARGAVGPDAGAVEIHLLEVATRLLEVGSEHVEHGHVRGVVLAWRSAAISAWLVG